MSLSLCLSGDHHQKWDMSIIKNLSAGGCMFIAQHDWDLKDRVVQLRINIPVLAPRPLEVEAFVLDTIPSKTSKTVEVRVKFINLSQENKEQLTLVGNMIEAHHKKNMVV